MLRSFDVAVSVSPSVLFPLICSFSLFIWLISLLSCLMRLFVLYVILAFWPPVLQSNCPLCFLFVFYSFCFCCSKLVLVNQSRNKSEGWSTANQLKSPVIILPAVPRRLFCFDSLVILDVTRCYLWLFLLYINIKIGENSY